MNVQTRLATLAPADRDTATASAPEEASANSMSTAKVTGTLAHPLEESPRDSPSTSRQAVSGPEPTRLDALETTVSECMQPVSWWARITRTFYRPDHRAPGHAPRREHGAHQDQQACPQRPDFLADAAMAREMFRL